MSIYIMCRCILKADAAFLPSQRVTYTRTTHKSARENTQQNDDARNGAFCVSRRPLRSAMFVLPRTITVNMDNIFE